MGSRVVWFCIVLAFGILTPSCRVMEKTFSRSRQTNNSTETVDTKSDFQMVDSSRTETKESITYTFTFKDPEDLAGQKLPQRTYPKDTTQLTLRPISTGQLDRMIDRAISLKVEVERAQTEQKAITSVGSASESSKLEESSDSDIREMVKKADSTWSANLPWYVWFLAAAVVAGTVIFAGKQLRIF